MKSNKLMMLTAIQIIIIISLLQVVNAREQIHYEGRTCFLSDSNVTQTGPYYKSVSNVLANLLSKSSSVKFFNASSGTGVNRVNGLYVCRPDLPLGVCSSCVKDAVDYIKIGCAAKKQAILWYQQCMVRYTNLTIYATYQTEPYNYYYGPFNVSDTKTFPAKLNKTLETVITDASMPSNTGRFASNSTDYTIFEGLYAMAWCTPDIKASECKSCLKNATSLMPNDGVAQYANVRFPNCIIKYDVAPFIFPLKSTFVH